MGYLTSNNILQQRKKEGVEKNAYFFIPITHSTAFLVSVSWKRWLNMTSYLFVQRLFCMEYHWLRNKHLVKHKATQTDLFSNTGAVSSICWTEKLRADLLTPETKSLPDFNNFFLFSSKIRNTLFLSPWGYIHYWMQYRLGGCTLSLACDYCSHSKICSSSSGFLASVC